MPGPSVNVNPDRCTMQPTGPVHAPPKNANGFVNFNATAPCTLNFSDSSVFGVSSKAIGQGNNQLNVQCETGSTNVAIAGCNSQSVGAMSAGRVASGPTDIIVP